MSEISCKFLKLYASSLCSVAKEKDIEVIIKNDIKKMVELIDCSSDLQSIINNKHIKIDILLDIFNDLLLDFNQVFKSFINEVIVNNKLSHISNIFKECERLFNEYDGLVDCMVESFVKLNDQQIDIISKKVNEITGKSVKINTEIKKSLLGGFIIKFEDYIIDYSALGMMNRI